MQRITLRHRSAVTARAAVIFSIIAAVMSFGRAAAQAADAARGESQNGATLWVQTTQRIKARVWTSTGPLSQPTLIVVVHGDSPDEPPTYQYRFAATAAAALDNAVVAAVLRPGYADGDDRSDGMRGETTGDNYTPEVLSAVATVVRELAAQYQPRRIVLVGHSGGAAIVGDLIGQPDRTPRVDGALLVSCPCDVAAWREHMFETKGKRPIWQRPERSVSPIALVADVPRSTIITLLVGEQDPVTPPILTQQYAGALQGRGLQPKLSVLPELGHNILLKPAVLDELKGIVGSLTVGK